MPVFSIWLIGLALPAYAQSAGEASPVELLAQTGSEIAPADIGAETVVAGLSQETVGIHANFDGSAIMIYGAVKRTAPLPDSKLGVIVTLEGPSAPLTIRKKSREMGIWINTQAVGVAAVPTYYAVASSAPIDTILSAAEDTQERITARYAMRAFAGPLEVEDARPFTEALLRIREAEGLFSLAENTVELQQDTLFRVDFDLPASLTEGDYKARIFLLRDGEVIDRSRAAIYVRKVGLERWLFVASREQPWLYGLMALALAAFSGWLASQIFRFIRS
jgi:uncharacterized protein (TIGR02186 family)